MPARGENKYGIAARVDIGFEREAMEDFVQFEELDGETMLCVLADGTGSREGYPHPASIATIEIITAAKEFYSGARDAFLKDPCAFLTMGMSRANRVLQAFKAGNEELFSGYAASVTCCMLDGDDGIYVTHSGNTRLYIVRGGTLRQLTRDHTLAQDRLEAGEIDMNTYYVHPDRLALTSGIGQVAAPEIQAVSGHIRPNDLILMTTDGIHYAIRPEHLSRITLESRTAEDAADNLVSAAKDVIKYPDNMGAVIIYDRSGMS